MDNTESGNDPRVDFPRNTPLYREIYFAIRNTQVWIGEKAIARQVGCKPSTVRYHTDKMALLGIVKKIRRPSRYCFIPYEGSQNE